jgi:quercetin dioxygenase-like cupin family protein
MEIRRFGPGYRRPDGPPGTQGLAGQVIWNDENASVSELAFTRRGFIAPHANPNTTLFIVVSGGGVVRVGDEQVPINHGEAVVWPPDILHGAYTDGVEMRAIVVELKGSAATQIPVIEGTVRHEDAPGPDERAGSTATGPPWHVDPPSAPPDATGTASVSSAEPDASRDADPASAAPPGKAAEPARGGLAERPSTKSDYDTSEGEPW